MVRAERSLFKEGRFLPRKRRSVRGKSQVLAGLVRGGRPGQARGGEGHRVIVLLSGSQKREKAGKRRKDAEIRIPRLFLGKVIGPDKGGESRAQLKERRDQVSKKKKRGLGLCVQRQTVPCAFS